MSSESPILIRIFKEESEVEVWKQDRSGQMALLKTYPICRWSGELGPKIREGDRQAPEGFYNITPGQMNPNSSLYLSFNLGYPNAFDQAHGRTGSQLMVHGDCSSRGCYAMTDEQISEVYALGREAFFGGQKSFQVQAYPFRMTPQNFARHRNNPNMPFWTNLKEGYDHFEIARVEPKINVCERRYVFNARAASSFEPTGKCPAFTIPEEIAATLVAKKQQDNLKIAEYIKTGTPAAPIKTNADGGMHTVFLDKIKSGLVDESFTKLSSTQDLPGTIPAHVNPPREAKPVWAPEAAMPPQSMAARSSLTTSTLQQPKASRDSSHASIAANPTPRVARSSAQPTQDDQATPRERAAERPIFSSSLLPGAASIMPTSGFDRRWTPTGR